MTTLYICSDSVAVLFDDGVEYTAPLRAVRRRVSEILVPLLSCLCMSVIIYLLCEFLIWWVCFNQHRQANNVICLTPLNSLLRSFLFIFPAEVRKDC